jgi:hypothetical protein
MYRNGNDYERMARLVIDIYIDYNITSFPVDEKELCRKLGLKLVPYSAYPEKTQKLLRKRSPDAFYSPATHDTPPTIFYNDKVESYGRQRYSIFHEVKHYVNNDTEESEFNDDMANYFSRYIMCPIPYLIKANINDELTLITDHGASGDAAENAIKNVRNRRATYGDKIFDYEQPLIDLLFPDTSKEECL